MGLQVRGPSAGQLGDLASSSLQFAAEPCRRTRRLRPNPHVCDTTSVVVRDSRGFCRCASFLANTSQNRSKCETLASASARLQVYRLQAQTCVEFKFKLLRSRSDRRRPSTGRSGAWRDCWTQRSQSQQKPQRRSRSACLSTRSSGATRLSPMKEKVTSSSALIGRRARRT